MSKEEILGNIFNQPHTQDWYKPVLNVMDEYAEQQSIAFAEWVNKNYERTNIFKTGNLWNLRIDLFLDHPITTQKAYQLFIKEQNNGK